MSKADFWYRLFSMWSLMIICYVDLIKNNMVKEGEKKYHNQNWSLISNLKFYFDGKMIEPDGLLTQSCAIFWLFFGGPAWYHVLYGIQSWICCFSHFQNFGWENNGVKSIMVLFLFTLAEDIFDHEHWSRGLRNYFHSMRFKSHLLLE